TLFLNTGMFVLICTSMALLLAVGFAWLIERTDIAAKGTLFVLILLPSAVPSLLMGISYIILAGPEAGLLNRLTDELFGVKPFNIFSLPAMFILQALSSGPASFLIVRSGLRGWELALVRACAGAGVCVRMRVPFCVCVCVFRSEWVSLRLCFRPSCQQRFTRE